jgi:hypothetical protein
MTLRRLFNLLLVACVIGVPPSPAQSDPCAVAAASGPMQQRIDLLLRRESEALDQYQQQVEPAIRCNHADQGFGQTCHDMLTKLRDESRQAEQDIALYQKSSARHPVDLFNIYVDLQSLLKDIGIFAVEDEFNGSRNRNALAQGYNSFFKLTDVWFTGEMRKMMRNSPR